MAAINSAISTYLDLATPQVLADSWGQLQDAMRSDHLLFGERLLCSALRPQFVTVAEWKTASTMSTTLVSAFHKAYQAMLSSPALRGQVWLTPEEETLVAWEAETHLPVPIGRLDCALIHDAGGGDPALRLLEYNAESPAAIAYEDGLARAFLQTPLLRAFQQHVVARPLWAMPAALQTLLHIYRAWGGRTLPTIAIVDWQGLPTQHEFLLFQAYFARHGIRALIVDPDALSYQGGVLRAAGEPVDFVYKRILTHELLARYGLQHPLIDAVRERAVCMMNRFSCKLLHKKASLALLSDEDNAALFNPAEQAAIARHIPWTRRMEERHTQFAGEEIDLLPFVLANRQRLVLKPNDEYGGKGVVLGWDVEDAQWQQAVADALAQPSVVQERVPLGSELFPVVLPDGSFDIQPRLVDFDPFIFDNTYAGGCLTRLSAGGLLNVTAGGGTTVPTMVVAA